MDKLRVLIIDDSEVLLSNLQATLGIAGFDVTTTTQTVGVGRQVADRDLVIVDYHMPGVKGGDVAKSLRSARESHSRKFEIYLYTTDNDMAARYSDLGFDGVLLGKGDSRSLVTQLTAIERRRRIASMVGAGPTPIPAKKP